MRIPLNDPWVRSPEEADLSGIRITEAAKARESQEGGQRRDDQ